MSSYVLINVYMYVNNNKTKQDKCTIVYRHIQTLLDQRRIQCINNDFIIVIWKHILACMPTIIEFEHILTYIHWVPSYYTGMLVYSRTIMPEIAQHTQVPLYKNLAGWHTNFFCSDACLTCNKACVIYGHWCKCCYLIDNGTLVVCKTWNNQIHFYGTH